MHSFERLAGCSILVDESLNSPSAGMARGVGSLSYRWSFELALCSSLRSSSGSPREFFNSNNRNLPTIYLFSTYDSKNRTILAYSDLTSAILARTQNIRQDLRGACTDCVGCPSVRATLLHFTSHTGTLDRPSFLTPLKNPAKRPLASDFLISD